MVGPHSSQLSLDFWLEIFECGLGYNYVRTRRVLKYKGKQDKINKRAETPIIHGRCFYSCLGTVLWVLVEPVLISLFICLVPLLGFVSYSVIIWIFLSLSLLTNKFWWKIIYDLVIVLLGFILWVAEFIENGEFRGLIIKLSSCRAFL